MSMVRVTVQDLSAWFGNPKFSMGGCETAPESSLKTLVVIFEILSLTVGDLLISVDLLEWMIVNDGISKTFLSARNSL
jgi:hypothetical protein